MKPTVSLDPEDLQFLMDNFVSKKEAQIARKERAHSDIEDANRLIETLNGKIKRLLLALPIGARPKGEAPKARTTRRRGRARWGQTEKVVTDFLSQRNGSGATVKEMAAATGIKYPTIHRQVNVLRERGQAKKDALFHWHLITK